MNYFELRNLVGACKVRIMGETDWVEVLLQEGYKDGLDASPAAQSNRAGMIGELLDNNMCDDPKNRELAEKIAAEYVACSTTFNGRKGCGTQTSILVISYRAKNTNGKKTYATQFGGAVSGINEGESGWQRQLMMAFKMLKPKKLVHSQSNIQMFLNAI